MKAVITAMDINMAKKTGQTRLSVPAGALITPQAADDARACGIILAREGAPGPGMGKSPAVGANPVVSPADVGRAVPGPDMASLEAEVRRLVTARIGPAANQAALDAAIRTVLAAGGASSAAESPFVRRAGGLAQVRQEALPKAGAGGTPDGVAMIEALAPEANAPGIGYLRWENASFTWTFPRAEVMTVLAGELTLSCEGASLTAAPGDSLRIAAGSTVTLAARGEVRCVHSSWPASS